MKYKKKSGGGRREERNAKKKVGVDCVISEGNSVYIVGMTDSHRVHYYIYIFIGHTLIQPLRL